MNTRAWAGMQGSGKSRPLFTFVPCRDTAPLLIRSPDSG